MHDEQAHADDQDTAWVATQSPPHGEAIDCAAFLDRVREAVRGHPDAFDLDADSAPDLECDPGGYVTFRVSAATYDAAKRKAMAIVAPGLDAAFAAIPPNTGWTIYQVDVEPAD